MYNRGVSCKTHEPGGFKIHLPPLRMTYGLFTPTIQDSLGKKEETPKREFLAKRKKKKKAKNPLPPKKERKINVLGGPNGLLPLAHQNRAVTGRFGKSEFLGRDISVICPRSCRVTEIQITSCPSKKEFFAYPISVICTGVVPARKSFLRLHFFLIFSDFF